MFSLSSYPSGAVFSLYLYVPGLSFSRVMQPRLSVVYVPMDCSAPSKNSIVAPGTRFPVAASVFFMVTLIASLERTVTPETSPSPLTLNESSSALSLYPCGASVSLNVYSPGTRFGTVSLPSLPVVPSKTTPRAALYTASLAPGTAALVTASTFDSVT